MKSNEGGFWTITLFAANEIPSAVVTFVALIMFLQMNIGVALSTLFATILLLPWVAQPFMRRLLPGMGGDRWWLHLIEIILAGTMALFALTLRNGMWWTMLMLAWISTLSAWHDIMAKHYFMRRTMMAQETHHLVLRALSSQMATVLTYGLMIMAVGVLQIYFRQRSQTYSWALGYYILAGAYLLMTLMNMLLLRNAGNTEITTTRQWPRQQKRWKEHLIMLLLMLMPQGLMFYSRTVFLLAQPQEGGLGCTLQEVGFAHGTIGVIAFLTGVALGKGILNKWGENRTKWPLTICLGLSPAVYLTMTHCKPEGVWMLSASTLMAQLLFGIGLNACRRYIENLSGERYRNSVNPLYIPAISLCIVLPMALSGFLLERLDFKLFFMLDTLCAPITWVAILCLTNMHKILQHKDDRRLKDKSQG
jgi:PAT family beta-lactamase induction signal transducer AmpG